MFPFYLPMKTKKYYDLLWMINKNIVIFNKNRKKWIFELSQKYLIKLCQLIDYNQFLQEIFQIYVILKQNQNFQVHNLKLLLKEKLEFYNIQKYKKENK